MERDCKVEGEGAEDGGEVGQGREGEGEGEGEEGEGEGEAEEGEGEEPLGRRSKCLPATTQ